MSVPHNSHPSQQNRNVCLRDYKSTAVHSWLLSMRQLRSRSDPVCCSVHVNLLLLALSGS